MSANPLFWMHFRLTGAWRNNLAITIAYVGLFLLGAGMAYRLTDSIDWGRVSAGCMGCVTMIQVAVGLLLVPSAIRKAVLRDFQNGMIESHRLSPMSGAKIVVGYMTGAPVLSGCLLLASLLLGTAFALHVARDLTTVVLSGWYVLQACLFCLVFMVSALSLLVALGTSGKMDVLTVGVLGTVFGGWAIVPFIPGVALVTGVITGGTIWKMLFGAGTPMVTGSAGGIVAAAAGQIAFGLVFLWAASRKVRSPERAMFGVGLGLLLAALWATTLVVGTAAMPAGHWLIVDYGDISVAQRVASIGTLLLVALFPLTGAAVERFHCDRTAAFGVRAKPGLGRVAPLVPIVVGLLAVLTLVLMIRIQDANAAGAMYAVADPASGGIKRAVPAALAALVLSCWTDFTLIYFAVTRGMRLFRWLLLSTLVLKLLPVLAGVGAAAAAEEFGGSAEFADVHFVGLSPIGTLILSALPRGNPWPGLVGQVLLAAGTSWLAWRAHQAVFANTGRSREKAELPAG